MPLDLSRRRFLRGLGLAVAAPAVIRVAKLMAIKPEPLVGDLYGRNPAMDVWPEIRRIVYSNRIIRTSMDIQAFRDRNVFLRSEDYLIAFRDIDIAIAQSGS